MQDALNDFLNYCRLERRLAPLTCSAYERDIRACLHFLAGKGIDELARVISYLARRLPADLVPDAAAEPFGVAWRGSTEFLRHRCHGCWRWRAHRRQRAPIQRRWAALGERIAAQPPLTQAETPARVDPNLNISTVSRSAHVAPPNVTPP